jgi:ectoine hydroxylase
MVLVSDSYQSRVDNESAIIMRQDPVIYPGVTADAGTGLSQHQLRNYQKNGFLFLKEFFSGEEAGLFMREAKRMAADRDTVSREETVKEPGSSEVRSVFRVHGLNALFGQIAADARLVNIARQILGSDVYVHQSRLNLKPGFAGKEFYWHSDFETWHVEDGLPRMRALSCVILLTENNEFNGPLMLIPGSHMHYISCIGKTPENHYKQSLVRQEYGVPDPDSLRFMVERGGIQAPKGAAGSVLFFDSNTMHGSSSNISPYPRNNLFFVYNSSDNRLGNPRCGLAPRPEFIAARQNVSALTPSVPAYLAAR